MLLWFLGLYKSSQRRMIQLSFSVNKHIHLEAKLLKSIIDFFCGHPETLYFIKKSIDAYLLILLPN